jgi:hypothetical protein
LHKLEDEEGSGDIENLLVDAEKGIIEIYVAFISLTEVFYITMQEKKRGRSTKKSRITPIACG